MLLKGDEAHRVVQGVMQCYDFLCPAADKPRIRFVGEEIGWEIHYACKWGAKHWSYARSLSEQLRHASRVYAKKRGN